jgi:hypothetical protein
LANAEPFGSWACSVVAGSPGSNVIEELRDLRSDVEHGKYRHLNATVEHRLVLLEGLDAKRRSRMDADFRLWQSAFDFRGKDTGGAVARIHFRRPLMGDPQLACRGS